MALSYSMYINGHTTRRTVFNSFCTLTSSILWCNETLSSALSNNGIYSQPGHCDDKSGTCHNKELEMAVWLFAWVSFAALVCARSTCDCTSWFAPQVLEEFFPSHFPLSKEKVIITTNTCKIMSLFVGTHFHLCKYLWSCHEKDLAEFTTLLLCINMLPLLRTTEQNQQY